MLRLTRDSVIYGLGSIAGKVTAVVLVPVLTRSLSTDDFGRLEVLSAMSSTIVSVLTLGVDRAALRLFFRESGPARKNLLASWYLFATLAIVPAGLICIIAADPLSTALFGSGSYGRAIRLVGGVVVFSMYQFVALAILRAQRRAAVYAALNGLTLAIYAGLTIALVFGLGASIEVVLAAALITWGMSAAVGLALVSDVAIARPSLAGIRALLTIGLPLAPAVVFIWGADFANRLIVLGFAGATQVAYLGLGLRAASVAGLAVTGLQLAWEPHAYGAGTAHESLARLGQDARRSLVLVTTMVVAVALVSREGVLLVSGDPYVPALPTLGFCYLATIATALFIITSTPSAIAASMGDIGRASIAGAVIATVSTLALTPPFGAAGAACAAAIGQLAAALLVGWSGARRVVLPVPWRPTSMVLAGGAAVSLAATLGDPGIAVRAGLGIAFVALLLLEGTVPEIARRLFTRARS